MWKKRLVHRTVLFSHFLYVQNAHITSQEEVILKIKGTVFPVQYIRTDMKPEKLKR